MSLSLFEKLTIVFGLFIFGIAVIGMVFGIIAYLDNGSEGQDVRTYASTAGVEIPVADSADMVLVPKEVGTRHVEWTTRPHSHGTGKQPVILKFENESKTIPSSLHDYTIGTGVFVNVKDSLYVHASGELLGVGDTVELSVVQGIPVAAGSFVITGAAGHGEWVFDLHFQWLSVGLVQVSGHQQNIDPGVDSRTSTVHQQIALSPETSWTVEFIKTGAGSPNIHQAKYEFFPSQT